MLEFFREFVSRFPLAKTPREKMLLIDLLLHSFHHALDNEPSRPVAVNLIEGNMTQVIEFLNTLTYGEKSTPEAKERLDTWRKEMETALQSWGTEGLEARRSRAKTKQR